MTLDVIGLAGFDYEFNALDPDPSKPNELSAAFKTIFQENESTLLSIAKSLIPPLRLLVRFPADTHSYCGSPFCSLQRVLDASKVL